MNGFGRTTAVLALLGALAGCDGGEGETIGPRGGVITSPDGRVTLEIPEGALSAEVELTIGEVDDAPEGALGPAYEVLPRGTVFDLPAELTYDLMVDDAFGEIDMSEAVLVTEKRDGWSAMADRAVDEEAGTVTASATFLSAYAVVAAP